MWAVEALEEIGKELRKSDWNFQEDPCSHKSSWASPVVDPKEKDQTLVKNNVTCSCSFPDQTYHVISMYVKLKTLIQFFFGLKKSLFHFRLFIYLIISCALIVF